MEDAIEEFIKTINGQKLHSSKEPSLQLKLSDHKESYFKPDGLWYSDDGWLNWCISESPGWIRPYIHEVLIADESNVLKINSIEAFEAFEDEYLMDIMPMPLSYGLESRHMFGKIDWPRVCSKYSAIEIFPYFWEKRLKSIWYYSWDCASGCVWDFSIVQTRLFAYYDAVTNSFIRAENGRRHSQDEFARSPSEVARNS